RPGSRPRAWWRSGSRRSTAKRSRAVSTGGSRLTSGGDRGDVPAVLHARPGDTAGRFVGPGPGVGQRHPERGHVEDTPAGGPALSGRPGTPQPAVLIWPDDPASPGRPSTAAVPAWNTVTPSTEAASSRPAITSPVRG